MKRDLSYVWTAGMCKQSRIFMFHFLESQGFIHGTLMCMYIDTLKTINFPFAPNRKFYSFLGVQIFKYFRDMLKGKALIRLCIGLQVSW